MRNLPVDLVRYHLISFLNPRCAVKLTQASRALFKRLRHKFHQTTVVSSVCFIEQSHSQSRQIGVCSSVIVKSKYDLRVLLQHIADVEIRKVSSMLHLQIEFCAPMGDIVLPIGLHTLKFWPFFNQSISGLILPASLHTLTFGWNFQHSISGITLPINLRFLTFDYLFNQSLIDVEFPPNLVIYKKGVFLDTRLIPAGIRISYI